MKRIYGVLRGPLHVLITWPPRIFIRTWVYAFESFLNFSFRRVSPFSLTGYWGFKVCRLFLVVTYSHHTALDLDDLISHHFNPSYQKVRSNFHWPIAPFLEHLLSISTLKLIIHKIAIHYSIYSINMKLLYKNGTWDIHVKSIMLNICLSLKHI